MEILQNSEIVKSMSLDSALLIYGVTGAVVATRHSVKNGRIEPGHVVDAEEIHELFNEALKGVKKHGTEINFVPKNLLAIGKERIIWRCPGKKRPIFFKAINKKLNKISGKSFSFPDLVFRVSAGRLYVYAAKRKDRAIEAKKLSLYHAPFYNIYDDGNVCLPHNITHPGCNIDDIPDWEKLFFESNFSHAGGGTKLCFTGGHDAFWLNYSKKNSKSFPDSVLKPMRKTLSTIVKNGEKY
ncbi:MAG: hypothetical protein A2017_18230 [Lentisphaerae bacterium GWF2_44_16]|nr:MAG: hypothetical protein A2017_18230 [Lentisphaerae bacterium GWF2_44_16]